MNFNFDTQQQNPSQNFGSLDKSEPNSYDRRTSSVEVTKNSKGYNWSIKLYFDKDVQSADDIVCETAQLDEKLRQQFERGE